MGPGPGHETLGPGHGTLGHWDRDRDMGHWDRDRDIVKKNEKRND